MSWQDVTRDKAVEVASADEYSAGKWSVWRHGGRRNNEWRQVGVWPDDDYGRWKSRDVWTALYKALRQGGVALLSPSRVVEAFGSGPTLRTRW